MVDFLENGTTKSAVRKLSDPIPDAAAFNTLVQSVISSNPFGCVSYMSSGANHPPVEKTRESYTARFIYVDTDAKRVGTGSETYDSLDGFNAGIAAVIANASNVAAHGGTVTRNPAGDTYAVTLRCHDPNAEMYFVNFSRSQVTITSYSDDAIRTVIETWADGIPALA
jgi:hypothetical protein